MCNTTGIIGQYALLEDTERHGDFEILNFFIWQASDHTGEGYLVDVK